MAANLPPHVRKEIAGRAWRLMLDGLTQAEIAAQLGREFPAYPVGQSSVSRSLSRTAERVAADLEAEARLEFFRQLAQLRQIHDDAAAGFERSKAPKKEATGTKVGEKSTTRTKITEREGNPLWLDRRLAALNRIARLLRLEERFAPPPPADTSNHALSVAEALAEMEARDATHPDHETPATEIAPDAGQES